MTDMAKLDGNNTTEENLQIIGNTQHSWRNVILSESGPIFIQRTWNLGGF